MSTQNNWYELHFNKNEPSKVMETADAEEAKAEGFKIVELLGKDREDEYCWLMICEWTAEKYQEALKIKIEYGDEDVDFPSNYYVYSKKRNVWVSPKNDAIL